MNQFEPKGNTTKGCVITLLILLLLIAAPPGWALDMDVFDECSVTIKPNVLFLMDTSLSMRRQDSIDSGMERYNSEGAFMITRDGAGNVTDVRIDPNNDPDDATTTVVERQSYLDRGYVGERGQALSQTREYEETVFYWDGALMGWHEFPPTGGLQLHAVQNQDVLATLLRFGAFHGGLDHYGDIDVETREENVYATGDYINYLKYMEMAQSGIDWDPDNEYDNTTEYRRFHGEDANGAPLGYGDFISNKVYVRMTGDIRAFNSVGNTLYSSIPSGVYINDPESTGRQVLDCATAKAELQREGVSSRKVLETEQGSCGGRITYTLMTGNFLNYLDMKKSRRYKGIDAIWSVVSNRPNDARYGIMQFDVGIFSKFIDVTHWETQGGDLSAACGASQDVIKRVLYGKFDHDNRSTTMEERWHPLHFGHPADIAKETPVAEALIEAGCYFSGQMSWFNLDASGEPRFRYTSPIQCADQKNHVIIITDGAPQDDFEALDGFLATGAKGRGTTWHWIEEKNFAHYDDATVTNGENPLTLSKIGNYNDVKPVDDDCLAIEGSCPDSRSRQRWLDDVAKYLNDKDMSEIEGKQNIQTHALGLVVAANGDSLDRPLMIETANAGQGHYAFTSSKDELIAVLNTILDTVMDDFSFSSAATPASPSDMTYSGGDMYMSSFGLEAGARGRGNVLKFHRDGGVVTGYNNAPLLSSNGGIDGDTRDLWYPGAEAAESDPEDPFPAHGLARKLYSQINDGLSQGATPTPEDTLNAVKTRRSIYFPYQRGGSSWSVAEIATLSTDGTISIPKEDQTNYSGDELYKFLAKNIYGFGYHWPLGDIIHSNTVVAQYPTSTEQDYGVNSYLFVGTNAGKLHCFDAASGDEKWAMIFPDFKDRLHQLESFFDINEHWFADGWMTLYGEHFVYQAHGALSTENSDAHHSVVKPTYLIAGERRGGRSYHILDISDVDNPAYQATIGGSDPWGLSWSKPQLCQVKKNDAKIKGFLVAGGYDPNQDNLVLSRSDSKGTFVSIYDFDGNELAVLGGAGSFVEGCVVSARIIDHDHDAERLFSRVYAGDLKGNVYHWNDEAHADGSWDKANKLFAGPTFSRHVDDVPSLYHQKVFYAPVAGMACAEDRVFFGTGDREHPLFSHAEFRDSVYSVPEVWSKTFTRNDLNKITLNSVSEDSNNPLAGATKESYVFTVMEPVNRAACEVDCDASLGDCVAGCAGGDDSCELACGVGQIHCKMFCGSGWYFDFMREGEKMISEPIALDNVLIFGTYTIPTVTLSADVCNAEGTCDPGKGRIYVVSTCEGAFSVTSYKLRDNPMPKPSLIFDKASGGVLISTGDGQIFDPKLPVIVPDYWKHSGSAL